jgi:hypothetical protein
MTVVERIGIRSAPQQESAGHKGRRQHNMTFHGKNS